MPRYCFTLQVRPDRLAEYAERHAAVWPEMCQALHDTGWRDYSLFLRVGWGDSFQRRAGGALVFRSSTGSRHACCDLVPRSHGSLDQHQRVRSASPLRSRSPRCCRR